MKRTLIIAEAGVNHNGSLDLAKRLVDAAKESGADIVKFQTGNPTAFTSRYAEKAEYQKENTGGDESQLEMLKKLMLSHEEFYELKDYCDTVGIEFLSTPFDIGSIDFLEKLGCDIWKIPSGEITNLPYLEKIASTHKQIIMSTGMATLDEVGDALQVLKNNGADGITLLQCTTQYPTPYESVNLRAMLTLKEKFGCKVGYSDHTKGIEVPIAAVAMGAEVIEKHFTLDRNMPGPDHQASLEPDELKAMVSSIRNIEQAMGDGIKKPSESEIPNIIVARKSIIAARNIKKGELFTKDNITTKRPGNGISPMKWQEVLGTRAKRDFMEDELIEL
ncbi:N-acetylneuraminate synthase [Candidatus Weimeria sp. HCP3S3_B5]|uniref:N-acetylneuraminate synthase n=1 Tax=Candidatus Weimeria sp. HCP3S3_B5 TaxID=3438871 RepID=UPI003F892722